MLMAEAAKGGVEVRCGQPVREVTHADGAFRVRFGDQLFTAPNLVIATGGPSIPRMGATGFAYDLARRFGLKVVETRPALIPLTLGGRDVLFRALRSDERSVGTDCVSCDCSRLYPLLYKKNTNTHNS